jgi:hypothetical protein
MVSLLASAAMTAATIAIMAMSARGVTFLGMVGFSGC